MDQCDRLPLHPNHRDWHIYIDLPVPWAELRAKQPRRPHDLLHGPGVEGRRFLSGRSPGSKMIQSYRSSGTVMCSTLRHVVLPGFPVVHAFRYFWIPRALGEPGSAASLNSPDQCRTHPVTVFVTSPCVQVGDRRTDVAHRDTLCFMGRGDWQI